MVNGGSFVLLDINHSGLYFIFQYKKLNMGEFAMCFFI